MPFKLRNYSFKSEPLGEVCICDLPPLSTREVFGDFPNQPSGLAASIVVVALHHLGIITSSAANLIKDFSAGMGAAPFYSRG